MDALRWHFSPRIVEAQLEVLLPEPQENDLNSELARLRCAMRSAVFSGGKRLRCQLALEAFACVRRASDQTPDAAAIVPAACALELIHAYSLVHDDLPSMDDSDTRRGRPSCHIQWGEATAILVGDGLQTLAFETLCSAPVEANLNLRAVQIIARASGESGMVGGQAIDIDWSQEHITQVTPEQLLQMHALKTGALIRAAAETGAVLANGGDAQITALREYGASLGRAFQIWDDVLDVEGDPALTGKKSTDEGNFKITASNVFGLQGAKDLALQSVAEAIEALSIFGAEADALRGLARFVTQRDK